MQYLLQKLKENGFVHYREVDPLFRDSNSESEFDIFLSELERTEADVRPDTTIHPVEAEKIETDGGEPLRIYLEEIARVPAVSAEREIELFQNIAHGAENSLLLKKEIVEANLSVVVSIARHYCVAGVDILDVIQCGNAGLFHAVDLFRCGRGYRFSTYAGLWTHRELDELVFSL